MKKSKCNPDKKSEIPLLYDTWAQHALKWLSVSSTCNRVGKEIIK